MKSYTTALVQEWTIFTIFSCSTGWPTSINLLPSPCAIEHRILGLYLGSPPPPAIRKRTRLYHSNIPFDEWKALLEIGDIELLLKHRDNIIFKTLVYPFFEEDTIRNCTFRLFSALWSYI